MSIDDLRAYINEYADTFDERVRTAFPVEAFLAWLTAKVAGQDTQTADQAAAAVIDDQST